MNLASDAKPSLLKEILGFRRLAHDAEQVAIQAVLVARHEFRERVQVPASKSGNFGFETHEHLHRKCRFGHHI